MRLHVLTRLYGICTCTCNYTFDQNECPTKKPGLVWHTCTCSPQYTTGTCIYNVYTCKIDDSNTAVGGWGLGFYMTCYTCKYAWRIIT